MGRDPRFWILTGRDRARPRWRRGGFTLVELLLVLTLIAALSGGLVVHLVGRLDQEALTVGGEDLAQALRYAAQQARLLGRAHRVVLLDGGSAYRVEMADDEAPDGFVPVTGLAGRDRGLPLGVRVQGVARGPFDLESVPEALLFAGGPEDFEGTIRLIDRRGTPVTIDVSAALGQVTLREDVP